MEKQLEQPIPIKGFKKENHFLSNFAISTVWWEGVSFPTVEHAYQAAKSENVDDHLRIAELTFAGEAKKEGRSLLLRDDWEEIKEEVMYDLCSQKFKNKVLKEKLLATGNCYLEETNEWGDIFWGVCGGIGQNKLGKTLMQIRKEHKNV